MSQPNPTQASKRGKGQEVTGLHSLHCIGVEWSGLSAPSVVASWHRCISVPRQAYFVLEEGSDDSDEDMDIIAPAYIQRVMSVQRAIETANFTSSAYGEVSLSVARVPSEGAALR